MRNNEEVLMETRSQEAKVVIVNETKNNENNIDYSNFEAEIQKLKGEK